MRIVILAAVLAVSSAAAQGIDPASADKPVTITYGELLQLMDVAAAEARAVDAETRTKAITDKVTAQVKPSAPKPGPVPPPKAEEPTNGE